MEGNYVLPNAQPSTANYIYFSMDQTFNVSSPPLRRSVREGRPISLHKCNRLHVKEALGRAPAH